MKKKVVWLVVSCWMVAALLLASCAPAVVEEEKVAPPVKEEVVPKEEVVVPKEEVVTEGKEMVKWTGTKLDGTVVEKMKEKPRYGGIHVTCGHLQPTTFDDIAGRSDYWQGGTVQEELLVRGWARGPAGTGEWTDVEDAVAPNPGTFETGFIAESYEVPDNETILWHIRQGIHFALDPDSEASKMVGGRELTAADVVYNMRRYWGPGGYAGRQYRYLSDMENPENSIYVSPTDKWTVVFKSKPDMNGILWRISSNGRYRIFAPEVIEKYGDQTDWKTSVGTGPFMLKDYVGGSSLTFVRNPNYWMNDPFFPENQLPYLDGFKFLIVPDQSTMVAALRTGRIDNIPARTGERVYFSTEESQALMKTDPELEYARYLGGGGRIAMRTDTKPFDDIRVRQALHMAVDNPKLLNEYYGGDGEMLVKPTMPTAQNAYYYIPLEEMPESVQELYGYHPDKAKQLLAEAGYPDGFKTNIICMTSDVDLVSIIKADWAKIGVDLDIDVKTATMHATIEKNKSHTQMYFLPSSTTTVGIWSSRERKGGGGNVAMTDEPWHGVIWERMIQYYFDSDKRDKVLTEPMAEGMPSYTVYINEQAFEIYLPMPYLYTFWQPWLKGYHGVCLVSYAAGVGWPRYVWLDQELKKSMGH
ncbi:ABC transporter substrate-binding protein [Chloroflexota bacterium]